MLVCIFVYAFVFGACGGQQCIRSCGTGNLEFWMCMLETESAFSGRVASSLS